ncbi:MAG: hypothetical protein ACLTMP_06590 [Eggerthella lenta]
MSEARDARVAGRGNAVALAVWRSKPSSINDHLMAGCSCCTWAGFALIAGHRAAIGSVAGGWRARLVGRVVVLMASRCASSTNVVHAGRVYPGVTMTSRYISADDGEHGHAVRRCWSCTPRAARWLDMLAVIRGAAGETSTQPASFVPLHGCSWPPSPHRVRVRVDVRPIDGNPSRRSSA